MEKSVLVSLFTRTGIGNGITFLDRNKSPKLKINKMHRSQYSSD